MPVKPVSPSVATQAVDVDEFVERVNRWLSSPWTQSERGYGKSYDTRAMTQSAVEEVARLFRAAGWDVDASSDRDGCYLHFKPRAIRHLPAHL